MNGDGGNGKSEENLSDKEVRDFLKCQTLESLRPVLTKNLTPNRHTDFLRSKNILSGEDCEEIESLPSRRRRASRFLDVLEQRGADAFDSLCASIRQEGTQIFLLREINQDLERRLRSYKELVGDHRGGRQSLAPLSPPPLKPPPPPPQRHGNRYLYSNGQPALQPITFREALETESRQVGRTMDVGGVTVTLSQAAEEATEESSSSKPPRLNVAQYLRSLSLPTEESTGPVGAENRSQCSSDRSFQVISSMDYSEAGSSALFGQGTAPTVHTLRSCQQDSRGDDHVIHRQPLAPRLSSRGLPHEVDPPSASAAQPGEGGTASDVSHSAPTSASKGKDPVEHSCALFEGESSTLQDEGEERSFFQSIEQGSLAPGVGQWHQGILCAAAVQDQLKALSKCTAVPDSHSHSAGSKVGSHVDFKSKLDPPSAEERKAGECSDNTECKPKDASPSVQSKVSEYCNDQDLKLKAIALSSSQQKRDVSSECYPWLQADHSTSLKTVVHSPQTASSSQTSMCSPSVSSAADAVEKSGDDVGNKQTAQGGRDMPVLAGGATRENRRTVGDRTRQSFHSSEC